MISTPSRWVSWREAGMAAVYGNGASSQYHYVQTTSLTQYAGALVSLALVAGVSLWGYQLIMRDVSGIPVVRAAEGAMRIAPQDAGGEIAKNAGFAVNEIAEGGAASGPSESLTLAPRVPAMTQEDLDVGPLAEAEEVPPAVDTALEAVTLPAMVQVDIPEAQIAARDALDMQALADQLVGDTPPLTPVATPETVEAPIIAASVPGVSVSLRPAVRPAGRAVVIPASASAPAAATTVKDTQSDVVAALVEADVTPVAATPMLVQLGAFSSEALAAEEWTRISAQFAEFMSGKDRVIEQASSSGATFYRLRTNGFADPAAARRFCETLKASDVECIPVVGQ